MCVNFKELNKITVFDPEPMMSPDDIFPKLLGSQIYSTFDFSKGYWAIPMEEKSKDVTTFVTSRGLMRFRVMPFGMVNSGSTYNRKLLDGTQSLENYVDDVLGHTIDWITHKEMLRDFFERVRKANLSLKPSKCKIGFSQVDFLGHTLLDKRFNLPTNRVSWTYPKNGSTNNQEGMSEPSRHDKLLSRLHS